MLEQMSEEATEVKPLQLSVIICTRDRVDTLLPAVHSVLADLPTDGSAELLVVDQGHDKGAEVLEPLLANDTRLRYLAEFSVGLSKARNRGVREARGAFIAFTDDDCIVEPGWAATLQTLFATHPEVGLIFGVVLPAPCDTSVGDIPSFEVEEGFLTRKKMLSSRYYGGAWSSGANMTFRRSLWEEQIGPFDERLGAGTPLSGAEDHDYALRAVCHHVRVYHSAQARVVHYGFRSYAAFSTLLKGYALGKGAMYAKQVRTGSLLGISLLISQVVSLAASALFEVIRGRRPQGANYLLYELKGLWTGLWLPLDHQQRVGSLVFREDA